MLNKFTTFISDLAEAYNVPDINNWLDNVNGYTRKGHRLHKILLNLLNTYEEISIAGLYQGGQ